MGIFSKLFGKDEADKETDKVKIVDKMASPSGFPELSEADKLLKEATAKKKSGNIKGAVETLRAAYKIISESSVLYPIETYLRLPLYLQEAGEKDEAWGGI